MVSISSRRDQNRIPIPLQRSHNPPCRMPLNRSNSDGDNNQPHPSHGRLRKAHSNDESSPSAAAAAAARDQQQVDRFGFITNIDSNGKIKPTNGNHDNGKNGNTTTPSNKDPPEDIKRIERRERKWNNMMQSWDSASNTTRRRQKLILNRLRKGLPDSMRGKVWPLLGGVNKKMRDGSNTKGIYQKLLRDCERDNQHALDHMPPEGPNKSTTGLSSPPMMTRSSSFQNIQETIERDIHRTFPRHTLFYDEDCHKDDLPPSPKEEEKESQQENRQQEDDDESHQDLGGLCNEDLTNLMKELDVGASPFEDKKKKDSENLKKDGESDNSNSDNNKDSKSNNNLQGKKRRESVTCETMLEAKGGQAALRRVLCAYSYYDREVGYCQGMNFIAAMFITIMEEEEAFWMLVAVMNDAPCHIRGLFGKGMTEAHKVLHVAERLIQHFLPKLAKHLEKENIHVTMFATQWLLTQYTSSFNFDLVTRVWDCFLVDGFKTIYRVMLALLQQVQPVLLKKSFEEILGFFREMPDHVDGNSVMETAMKIPLKRKHIARYESEWYSQQENKS